MTSYLFSLLTVTTHALHLLVHKCIQKRFQRPLCRCILCNSSKTISYS